MQIYFLFHFSVYLEFQLDDQWDHLLIEKNHCNTIVNSSCVPHQVVQEKSECLWVYFMNEI